MSDYRESVRVARGVMLGGSVSVALFWVPLAWVVTR